jgi:hypothetical protein
VTIGADDVLVLDDTLDFTDEVVKDLDEELDFVVELDFVPKLDVVVELKLVVEDDPVLEDGPVVEKDFGVELELVIKEDPFVVEVVVDEDIVEENELDKVVLGVYVARKQGQADDKAETVVVGPQLAK